VARHVLSYRHVLVASPTLVERIGVPADPAEILRFPCGAWASGIEGSTRWDLGGIKIAPRAILQVNDYRQLCHRALTGDIVTELPPFIAADLVRQGRLVPLLRAHPLPEQPIHLLYPRHRERSSVIRAYLDFCQSQLPRIVEACDMPAP